MIIPPNRIRHETTCLLIICTCFSFVAKITSGFMSFHLCYLNKNRETRASLFPHFLPMANGIFFTYNNLKWKRLSSRDAFLFPLPYEGRDIKHAITTADLNCIYLRNNFETFREDLPSSTPLFQRAPFSCPFSAFFSNLAFETAAAV